MDDAPQDDPPPSADVPTAPAEPPSAETAAKANLGAAELIAKVRAAVAKTAEPACPTADMPLQQSSAGGSGAFLVRASDGKRYWCKGLDNGQSPRVPINEQIVGRLGNHIGAAVCRVSLIKVPAELEGWEFRPGKKLKAGYVHGSLAVEPAIETRAVLHPRDDDNPFRLTSLAILGDWCWASDAQWLYCPVMENRYSSHDHGHYFPGGPSWTAADLQANDPKKMPNFPLVVTNLKLATDLLANLGALDLLGIAGLLSGLPTDWPVSEEELVSMAFFLESRRAAVLQRLAPASGRGDA